MEYYEIDKWHKVPKLPLSKEFARELGHYGTPGPAFLDELTQTLKGRKVLEVFSGNGRLAGELASRGVEVTATTLFSSHDKHEAGLYYPVRALDAESAVAELGHNHDVLLVCWPVASFAAVRAAALWGPDKDIVYLGEVSDYTQGLLGGCATDEFFEHITVVRTFDSHIPRNMIESAFIGRFRREHLPLLGKNYFE